MEDLYFTYDEVSCLESYADNINRIIGRARGRAEAILIRREMIVNGDFAAEYAKRNATKSKEAIAEKKSGDKQNTRKATAFLRNYKKEFFQMPKKLQDKINQAILRKSRFHNGVYEKRVRIDGIDIYGCSSDLEECESRFLEDLAQKIFSLRKSGEQRANPSTHFSDWAELWFDQVFKPNVTPQTYSNEYYRYTKHIKPYFGKMKLRDILPIDCIRFFNQMLERGIGRTAESCYGVVRRVFEFAVESNLIAQNPMVSVKPIKSERKNGVPLSKDEENKLLSAVQGTKHEAVIALALYTGLRPCEHSSATIEGNFIQAQNRKQKNVKKVVFKKIPITPMLRPFIPLISSLMEDWETHCIGAHATLKKILPNHRLYDLRTTFATRCQECGVPDTVVQNWLGHKPKTLLGCVYTKFSDDYLLSEGNKVFY